MTAVWITIAGLAAGSIAIKAAGPLLLGGRDLPPRAAGVIALLAPALLAALVVVETVGAEDAGLTIDARLAGLGGAAGGLALKLPMLAVVALAAAAAALARALA
jgi:hypothetical protein